MKIKLFILLLLILLPISVKADNNIKCIDGDTFKMEINGRVESIRLLAVDTPELKSDNPWAIIAKDYTCKELLLADNIRLEKDINADDRDRYNRLLRWVFVDDRLLQSKLVKSGYAMVAYLYDDYQYTNQLLYLEKEAQIKKRGIWQSNLQDDDYYLITTIAALILYLFIKTVKKY